MISINNSFDNGENSLSNDPNPNTIEIPDEIQSNDTLGTAFQSKI